MTQRIAAPRRIIRKITPTLAVAFALLLSPACGGGTVNGLGGGDSGPHVDGLRVGDGQVLGGDGSLGDCPCQSGLVCYEGRCVADRGPCTKDDECIGDTFCHQGRCVAYGSETKSHGVDCIDSSFAAEALELPTIKCAWKKDNVRAGTMVADLDGDKKPEIIFSTMTGNLVAIRGHDCTEVFNVKVGLALGANPAIADLDGDGVPEIVSISKAGYIVVFDNKGKLLATATVLASRTSAESSGGPAIANIDEKGNPEIIYAGLVLRYGAGKLTVVSNGPKVKDGYRGVFSTVADVDLDGKLEIVAGNRIIDAQTGADKTPAAMAALKGGHVAIAQWDKSTPEPEIIVVSSTTAAAAEVRVLDVKTGATLFGPYTFGQKYGGPPTVADFDGDGEPEIGVAGYVGYAVFDQECAVKPLPAFCHSPGIRWLKITQDKSSGCTGSSVFDFNGDGKAEAVYRDECWLRVYDGATGKLHFASPISSGTKMELPAIADVDNDGHADIVISSDTHFNCGKEAELNLPHPGATKGVYVLQDPKNRWMPSRPIWNQHAYHITNINDDATVPVKMAKNWESWNNFRQNTQGLIKKEEPAVDVTSRSELAVEAGALGCSKEWKLTAQVCSRGMADAAVGVVGTFYSGDPRKGGVKLCEGKTAVKLAPGACDTVTCTATAPTTQSIDLWFVADGDNGQVECKELNNVAQLANASCQGPVG